VTGMSKKITVSVELRIDDAIAIERFFSRSGIDDYKKLAASNEQSYQMRNAALDIRSAIANEMAGQWGHL